MTVIISVPGKLMISGEYAVLFGGSCLASTVAKKMTVTARRCQNAGFLIKSDLWTTPKSFYSASGISQDDPAMGAFRAGIEQYGLTGVEIEINSELGVTSGLGSSSAVRLGILFALLSLKKPGAVFSNDEIRDVTLKAIELQRAYQKTASGYDFLTQVTGGVVHIDFSSERSVVTPLETCLPQLRHYFHPVTGGLGDSTAKSVHSTMEWLATIGKISQFKDLMQNLTASIRALLLGKPELLKTVVEYNKEIRSLMCQSPNFPIKLFSGLSGLEGFDKTWTVKTTGAGGEDALLLIGCLPDLKEAFSHLASKGWHRLQEGFCHKGFEIKSYQGEC